jgi:hypothetical protein
MDTIMNNIEFEVGQEVTYQPHEWAIPAIVTEVDANTFRTDPDDKRIYYRLSGVAANAVSSGEYIHESSHYVGLCKCCKHKDKK